MSITSYNMLWSNSLHYPPFFTIVMGIIILFSYVDMKYFNYIHPPYTRTPSPFTLLLVPYTMVTLVHSHHCSFVCLFVCFGSRILIWEKHVILSFWVWLVSLSMVISNSIHLPANSIISFFYEEENPIVCIRNIFFIHSSVVGYWGWFHR
jgi:hypothetical protein